MRKRYFISFVEEFWQAGADFCGAGKVRKDINNFVMGRVEVYDKKNRAPWANEEIRFFSRDKEGFSKFREEWDFKDVDKSELEEFRKIIREKWDYDYSREQSRIQKNQDCSQKRN